MAHTDNAEQWFPNQKFSTGGCTNSSFSAFPPPHRKQLAFRKNQAASTVRTALHFASKLSFKKSHHQSLFKTARDTILVMPQGKTTEFLEGEEDRHCCSARSQHCHKQQQTARLYQTYLDICNSS